MAHYSIAHVVRLRDGTFAVRSTEYSDCEARDVQLWPAREQFREALSLRAQAAIAKGELPPIYQTVEEARVHLPAHCEIQVEAPDRLPNTYDYAIIVEVELAEEEAERFALLRVGSLLPEAAL